jgi:UDP-N-acetylglucosamine 1-carboxyvinyltransferase
LETIKIRGGRPLSGNVKVGGSKNDTVAIMAGALLVPGKTVLRNVPRIRDVNTLIEIFRRLGAVCTFFPDDSLEIDASNLTTSVAPNELVSKMRASFYVLGALLSRFGRAEVAMPGGCDIGARPVNFHVKGLEQLGCQLNLEHGIYYGSVRRLVGASLYLEFPSAGATQHLLIAASRACGTTVIENCATEPEIVSLAEFLNTCGAHIHGAGTPTITIEGVEALHPATYSVIPDRLQAGTYAVAAAITGGDVLIENAVSDHSRPLLSKLAEAGVDVQTTSRGLRVRRMGKLYPTDIKTLPHPGFPTDMQQPFTALMCLADGVSMVTETLYESRFRYTTELERMGADIRVDGRTAKITGVEKLSGAKVTCTDLRAGAAMVCAALAAEGETEIDGLTHLDRGYENIVPNLQGLGADIVRLGPQ